MLRVVLQQTDPTMFQDYLAQLFQRLPWLSQDFFQYFQSEWLGKEKWWAYCYRTGMGINTNMMVEAFHRVFKYNYLKGKYNKRVDYCLVNLLKYTRDKLFERLIKLTKGKSTGKLKIIQDRHSRSTKLPTESVECTISDCKLKIESGNSSSIYIVSKQQHTCTDDTCQLRCTECSTDSGMHTTVHIHLPRLPDSAYDMQAYTLTKAFLVRRHKSTWDRRCGDGSC